MIEYDPSFWKYGENVTAGEFCEYLKENIPHDAIILFRYLFKELFILRYSFEKIYNCEK